jgi:pimeloyl-ACP methyl ester carboxylesterase
VHLYCVGAGSPTVVIVGAGFSFNWGLVQPEVAKFTKVCAYDHSGAGWSEDGPPDSCVLRVNEVHTALKNLGMQGPYVLVGHSLGGLVARVYAAEYPGETAGVVFVDHALEFRSSIVLRGTPGSGNAPHPPDAAPSGPVALPAGKLMGIEDDPNFSKLSDRDRKLQTWAMAQPRNQAALLNNRTMMPKCSEQADAFANEHSHPLGEKPVVDVDTDTMHDAPGYLELQKQLLALSLNSKEMIAEKSGHFVIIDRPDVVVDGIRQVVESVRDNNHKL